MWRRGLLPHQMQPTPILFVANELDQVRVGHDSLVYPNCEWLRVNFRIFEGDYDFQVSVIHSPESLSHFASVR